MNIDLTVNSNHEYGSKLTVETSKINLKDDGNSPNNNYYIANGILY